MNEQEFQMVSNEAQLIQVYRFDMKTGIFIEPLMVATDDIPEDCTEKVWEEPCFTPQWNFEKKEWGDTGKPTIVIIED